MLHRSFTLGVIDVYENLTNSTRIYMIVFMQTQGTKRTLPLRDVILGGHRLGY